MSWLNLAPRWACAPAVIVDSPAPLPCCLRRGLLRTLRSRGLSRRQRDAALAALAEALTVFGPGWAVDRPAMAVAVAAEGRRQRRPAEAEPAGAAASDGGDGSFAVLCVKLAAIEVVLSCLNMPAPSSDYCCFPAQSCASMHECVEALAPRARAIATPPVQPSTTTCPPNFTTSN